MGNSKWQIIYEKDCYFIVVLHRILSLGCRNTTHSQNKTQQITKQSFILHPEIMNVIKELQSDVSSDRTYAVYFTDTNDGFTMLKQDTIIYVAFLKISHLPKM